MNALVKRCEGQLFESTSRGNFPAVVFRLKTKRFHSAGASVSGSFRFRVYGVTNCEPRSENRLGQFDAVIVTALAGAKTFVRNFLLRCTDERTGSSISVDISSWAG